MSQECVEFDYLLEACQPFSRTQLQIVVEQRHVDPIDNRSFPIRAVRREVRLSPLGSKAYSHGFRRREHNKEIEISSFVRQDRRLGARLINAETAATQSFVRRPI